MPQESSKLCNALIALNKTLNVVGENQVGGTSLGAGSSEA